MSILLVNHAASAPDVEGRNGLIGAVCQEAVFLFPAGGTGFTVTGAYNGIAGAGAVFDFFPGIVQVISFCRQHEEVKGQKHVWGRIDMDTVLRVSVREGICHLQIAFVAFQHQGSQADRGRERSTGIKKVFNARTNSFFELLRHIQFREREFINDRSEIDHGIHPFYQRIVLNKV